MTGSIKIRLFPTEEQEDKLWEHVHAARKVWNWGLNIEMELFQNNEKHLSAYSLKKVLTQAKKSDELKWLNNVSSQTLNYVLLDLGKAYDDFFAVKPARYTKAKKAKAARTGKKLTSYDLEGHPKFKSKKDNDFRFPVRYDHTYFADRHVNIEKIGKISYQSDQKGVASLQSDEAKTSFPQGKDACKISNPRIKYTNGKWILSFGMERDNQALSLTNKPLGIDLGIKTTVTASFGGERIEYHNINKSKRVRGMERKLRHIQRSLSRKYETNGKRDIKSKYGQTKGVMKVKALKQKIESKLSNIRKNHTHQTTHELVSLLPHRVVMEDLSVKNMMKNKHLSKAIQDQAWGEFIRQMKYKCEWSGIEFIQVGRYYPSSKKCSGCGFIKKDLKLRDRVYECDACGLVIDRDYNAALNLERYGLPEEKGQSA